MYVGCVTLIALAWGLLSYLTAGPLTPAMIQDALILSTLAIAGEMLGFMLPRSAAGSIAFIPYFASAIVVPGWPSVLFVRADPGSALELFARRNRDEGDLQRGAAGDHAAGRDHGLPRTRWHATHRPCVAPQSHRGDAPGRRGGVVRVRRGAVRQHAARCDGDLVRDPPIDRADLDGESSGDDGRRRAGNDARLHVRLGLRRIWRDRGRRRCGSRFSAFARCTERISNSNRPTKSSSS